MNAVIVHEWVEPTGGSEKVVDSFVELLPEADLVCLWNDAGERFGTTRVRESPIARTPLRRSKLLSLPLQPIVWRWVPGEYDLALVSSHLFAHHARFPAAAAELRKFVYVHTPARYIWEPELDFRNAGFAAKLARPTLRAVDRFGARGKRSLAANSGFVAERIRRTWDEDAVVIYPPVDTEGIQEVNWEALLTSAEHALLDSLPSEFVFTVGRMVGYKRFEKVIEFAKLADVPVVIAGSGPEEAALRQFAADVGAPVEFIGRVSDAAMFTLHKMALAFAFFAIEDFGMTTVEAMAMGTPVIACNLGGSAEIVVDGVTGALCEVNSTEDLRTGLDRAINCSDGANRSRAEYFSKQRFLERIGEWTGLPVPA